MVLKCHSLIALLTLTLKGMSMWVFHGHVCGKLMVCLYTVVSHLRFMFLVTADIVVWRNCHHLQFPFSYCVIKHEMKRYVISKFLCIRGFVIMSFGKSKTALKRRTTKIGPHCFRKRHNVHFATLKDIISI